VKELEGWPNNWGLVNDSASAQYAA